MAPPYTCAGRSHLLKPALSHTWPRAPAAVTADRNGRWPAEETRGSLAHLGVVYTHSTVFRKYVPPLSGGVRYEIVAKFFLQGYICVCVYDNV